MDPDEQNTSRDVVRQFCAWMSDNRQSGLGTEEEFDFAKAFSSIGEQSSNESENVPPLKFK